MVGGLGGWLVSLALDGAGHPVLGLMGIGEGFVSRLGAQGLPCVVLTDGVGVDALHIRCL